MKANPVFGRTMGLMERALDLRSRNQKLIVSNIANMDTPNYKAFRMLVEAQMERASNSSSALPLARTRTGHLGDTGNAAELPPAERVMDDPYSIRGDGNTVQLEQEMSNLAENTLMYNAVSRLVADKFKLLQSVIKGGGGS
jgi:flagellar basal-body rod protein FlgB